jgi:hypothetical protein
VSQSEIATAMLAVRELIDSELRRLQREFLVANGPGIRSPRIHVDQKDFAQRTTRIEAAIHGFEFLVKYLSATEQRAMRGDVAKFRKRLETSRKNLKAARDERKSNESRDLRLLAEADRLRRAGVSERELAGILVRTFDFGADRKVGVRRMRTILKQKKKAET